MYDNELFTSGNEPASRREGVGCISDLALDRAELRQLAAGDAERVRSHLSGCGGCRARADLIRRERSAFIEENNLGQLAADALSRARLSPPSMGAPSWMRRLRISAVTAAACAGVAFLVFTRSDTGSNLAARGGSPDRALGERGAPAARREQEEYPSVLRRRATQRELETTAVKGGGFQLSTYVKHGERGGPGTLHTGEPLHPGDQLQFRYNGSQGGYLAILAVDARSEISVYYPTGPQAARVDGGREIDLAQAVELDGTLGPERIVAVRCDQPLGVAEAVAAARRAMTAAVEQGRPPTDLPPLGLPCAESRVDIVKVSPGPAR